MVFFYNCKLINIFSSKYKFSDFLGDIWYNSRKEVINLHKSFDNNTIYYTIINKKELDFINTKNTEEKIATLQAKYVLNCMLDYFNIPKSEIVKTELGKPFFKDQAIYFNYSHSTNFIACAISKYNVGIDIEETNRVITDTMIKVCNFNKDSSLEEFVKREAFCKLTGNGITAFFDNSTYENTTKNCFIIKNKKYICAIWSDCLKPLYIKQNLKFNKKNYILSSSP